MVQKTDSLWYHLRAFVLLVLLIDHGVHAYGLYFNKWHFIGDQGFSWADYFYLYDNNIITPLLFFLLGMSLIPSLEQKGLKSYLISRLWRWGVPWVIGILFIVPLLCYPRFSLSNPDVSYIEYVRYIYFPHRMQGGGPFWILWYSFFLTACALILYKFTPFFRSMSVLLKVWAQAPFKGTLLFTGIICLLYYVSDLYFGPYMWIGFVDFLDPPLYAEDASWVYYVLKLFRIQGSKFLIQALCFIIGVAFGGSSFMNDASLKESWARHWKGLLLASCGSFSVYAWYVMGILNGDPSGFEALYNHDFSLLLKDGYEGPRLREAFTEHWHLSGPRLILQGITCVLTALAWIACSHRFFSQPHRFFAAYTPHSYGIFLIHEVPVIWAQYGLISWQGPALSKILLVLLFGLTSSWILTAFLRKSVFMRKIL
jgi:glucan biosynthesis protein C